MSFKQPYDTDKFLIMQIEQLHSQFVLINRITNLPVWFNQRFLMRNQTENIVDFTCITAKAGFGTHQNAQGTTLIRRRVLGGTPIQKNNSQIYPPLAQQNLTELINLHLR